MWKVVTQPNCPFCVQVKELLKKEGIAYSEVDITHQDNYWVISLMKSSGYTTVPQVFNERGRRVGGYMEVENYVTQAV